MSADNTKLKILYLMKVLNEKTDEDHPMNVTQIIKELKRYGVQAEKKSIYSGIKVLEEFGLDICKASNTNQGYFIGSRGYDTAELRVLVDAIQAAHFLTAKKTKDLVDKLCTITSEGIAASLKNQIFITDRFKSENELIYYLIDKIHRAINAKKKITFKYFDYDIEKNKIFRKEGNNYTVSPFALVWKGDNYYVIGNSNSHTDISHYRVDRMENVEVTEERSIDFSMLNDYKNYLSISDYVNKLYNMYSGNREFVELRFKNEMLNIAIDKFGLEATLIKDGDYHFKLRTDVIVSEGFISWLLQFGDGIELLSPHFMRIQLKDKVEKINLMY